MSDVESLADMDRGGSLVIMDEVVAFVGKKGSVVMDEVVDIVVVRGDRVGEISNLT
jgi:ribosomal protein S12